MRRKNFQYLKEHILPLSVASEFNEAKLEWELDYIMVTQDFGTCPCSQPIKEHCYLRNNKNGNTTYVGNICLKRFMEIDATKVFAAIKRVLEDRSSRPNRDLIEYANRIGHLYGPKEYNFLQNIKHKRNLSEKQLGWLLRINRRIVEGIVVQPDVGPVQPPINWHIENSFEDKSDSDHENDENNDENEVIDDETNDETSDGMSNGASSDEDYVMETEDESDDDTKNDEDDEYSEKEEEEETETDTSESEAEIEMSKQESETEMEAETEVDEDQFY